MPRSLPEPISGPRIWFGWKTWKRTRGEKSAGTLRFPLFKVPTSPGHGLLAIAVQADQQVCVLHPY